MDTYLNNSTASGTRARRAAAGAAGVTERRAADQVRPGARRSSRSSHAGVSLGDDGGRGSGRTARSSAARRRSNFMRYAADNRVIQTLYAITTGPWRFAFYGAVIVAVGLSVYFPVRDLYAAYRTGDILERQLEVRTAYNKRLESQVDKLLSTEGIEDAARKNLGLVMPGEHAVEVIGLDDDGSGGTSSASGDASAGTSDASSNTAADDSASAQGSGAGSADASDGQDDGSSTGDADQRASDGAASSQDEDGAATDQGATGEDARDEAAGASSEPTTSAEVEAAEQAVVGDAPWYIRILDAIFFYQGIEGQTVSSTGA